MNLTLQRSICKWFHFSHHYILQITIHVTALTYTTKWKFWLWDLGTIQSTSNDSEKSGARYKRPSTQIRTQVHQNIKLEKSQLTTVSVWRVEFLLFYEALNTSNLSLSRLLQYVGHSSISSNLDYNFRYLILHLSSK